MKDVTVCFIHFKTLSLKHLDAAWFSLSKQDFTHVRSVCFLDNDSPDAPSDIHDIILRYPVPVPVQIHFEKHGDLLKTHSYSVNRVTDLAEGQLVFLTRSDFILHENALSKMLERWDPELRLFITSWCAQMAYDAQLSNTDDWIDIDAYDWRNEGFAALFKHPWIVRFLTTAQDAGVWLTEKKFIREAGGLNEQLTSWGYQQSVFQRMLKNIKVKTRVIEEFLFAHLHHSAPRDFQRANTEYRDFGRGA